MNVAKAPRDPLDRDYTPDYVAAACVSALSVAAPAFVLEPSVGGGAFARAVAARWPYAYLHGLDLDKGAAGFGACRAFVPTDFLTWRPEWPYVGPGQGAPDLVLGNPPYGPAESHVRHALEVVRPGGVVAFLLRLGFLASLSRMALWRDYPPTSVGVLSQRPSFRASGKTDATEYAWFTWDTGALAYGPRQVPSLYWINPGPRPRPAPRAAPSVSP